MYFIFITFSECGIENGKVNVRMRFPSLTNWEEILQKFYVIINFHCNLQISRTKKPKNRAQ